MVVLMGCIGLVEGGHSEASNFIPRNVTCLFSLVLAFLCTTAKPNAIEQYDKSCILNVVYPQGCKRSTFCVLPGNVQEIIILVSEVGCTQLLANFVAVMKEKHQIC